MSARRRGASFGLPNLSRNLGLIAGAFAFASANEITTARPEAVAADMQVTFTVAAALIVVALGIAVGGRMTATRRSLTANVRDGKEARPRKAACPLGSRPYRPPASIGTRMRSPSSSTSIASSGLVRRENGPAWKTMALRRAKDSASAIVRSG